MNKDAEQILAQFNYRCALDPTHTNPVIHHILPRGVGGTDDADNLIPLCVRCHGKIHAEGTRKWRSELFNIKVKHGSI